MIDLSSVRTKALAALDGTGANTIYLVNVYRIGRDESGHLIWKRDHSDGKGTLRQLRNRGLDRLPIARLHNQPLGDTEVDRLLESVRDEIGEVDWRHTETIPEDYYAG